MKKLISLCLSAVGLAAALMVATPTLAQEPEAHGATPDTSLMKELAEKSSSDPKAAIERASEELENNPESAELYAVRALAYMNTNNTEAASADLEKARSLFEERGDSEAAESISQLTEMMSPESM